MMGNIRTLGTGGILLCTLLSGCGESQHATTNTKGLQRLPQEAQAFQQEDKVAIIVAMEEYHPDSGFRSLRYPEEDAEALQTELTKLDYTVKVLKNEHAKSAFILKAINEAGKLLDKDGTLVFAFTGHGFADAEQGQNYFAVDGTSHFNLSESGLALNTVKTALRKTGARRMMMFIDACRDNPVEGKSINNPGFNNLADSESLNILFSTGQGDISFEDDNLKHGVFSHFLLEGLRGSAAQANQLILFEDLATYVTTRVKNWTYTNKSRVQKPFKAGESSGQFLVGAIPITEAMNSATSATAESTASVAPSQNVAEATAADTSIAASAAPALPVTPSVPKAPFDMVRIHKGCFQMGQSRAEKRWLIAQSDQETYDKYYTDETQQEVCIEQDFEMARTEVTVSQFRQFVDATGYKTQAEQDKGCRIWNKAEGEWQWSKQHSWRDPGFTQTDDHPVTCVSWQDAMAYIKWLNREYDSNFNLPTEVQWEYAARAGKSAFRYWGDDKQNQQACRFANVADKTSAEKYNWSPIFDCDDGYADTAPVGSFKANAFGLYDMLGNVWEWSCLAYEKNHDGSEQRCVESDNEKRSRVFRGGSWVDTPWFVRSADRDWFSSTNRNDFVGFRLSRTP